MDVILQECGEFETLYPDPDFLQNSIALWGRKYYRTFEKWVKALALEYNPIENYDRLEDWAEEGHGTESGRIDSTGSNAGSTRMDNLTTAYETDRPRLANRADGRSSDSTTNTSKSSTESDGSKTRKGRIHGNIGVLTTQEMLQSELQLARFTLLQQIADLFKMELCVFVYY